jgi:hypothetical protein
MKATLVLAIVSVCLGCRSTTRESPEPQPSAATASPQSALDELDQRRPVPLLPVMAQHQKQNMREHLEAVQAVVAAAGEGDFDGVAVAARRMGYSESMGRMCEHMGASAPGFTEQALSFHHTADEIALAAARHDGPGVLVALSATLRACTGCHTTFKQRVVATLAE